MVGPVLFRSSGYTNRFLSEVLPDGSWHRKPAFIVGGGPSLRDFDFSRLRGVRSIGVNLAFMKFDPTIIFSMDTRFLKWILSGTYGKETLQKFDRSPGYKTWLLTYRASLRDDIFIVPVFRSYEHGLNSFTLTSTEGICHGNSSGYAAVNLAVALGADPIYLLGFDMKHEPDGRTHWHGGHPIPQPQKHLDSFLSHFRHAAPIIAASGTHVINLNPDSALDCFEFGDLKEVL